MITGEISFQIWAQDYNTFWMIKKFRQKRLVKTSKFVWRKKSPPRAQIFRYFRIKNLGTITFFIDTVPDLIERPKILEYSDMNSKVSWFVLIHFVNMKFSVCKTCVRSARILIDALISQISINKLAHTSSYVLRGAFRLDSQFSI